MGQLPCSPFLCVCVSLFPSVSVCTVCLHLEVAGGVSRETRSRGMAIHPCSVAGTADAHSMIHTCSIYTAVTYSYVVTWRSIPACISRNSRDLVFSLSNFSSSVQIPLLPASYLPCCLPHATQTQPPASPGFYSELLRICHCLVPSSCSPFPEDYKLSLDCSSPLYLCLINS